MRERKDLRIISRCLACTTEVCKCHLVRWKGHRSKLGRKVECVGFGCVKFDMPIKHPHRDAKETDYTGGIKGRGPG